jgi:peptidoglycan/LPS O-acetylase OafA/YrhL
VLTYKFFRDRSTRIALVPIAVKRYMRLLFPILFSNILAYLLLKLALYYNQPAAVLTRSEWLDAFWKFEPNLVRMIYESFIGAFFSKGMTYNNVLWTMRYEFYGSIIVYACIALFGRHPRRDWFYLAAVLIFRRSFYLAFILGMVLSDLVTRERNIFRRIRHKGYYVALLLLGLFIGSFPAGRSVAGTLYEGQGGLARVRTWQIAGAAMVMVALLNSRRLQALFSMRPFLFLGRISFSIYLLHFILIGSLSSGIFLLVEPFMSYHAAFLIAFFLSLPVMIIASHYMYRFVDAKGMGASQIVYRTALDRMRAVTGTLGRVLPGAFVKNRFYAFLFYPDPAVTARKDEK